MEEERCNGQKAANVGAGGQESESVAGLGEGWGRGVSLGIIRVNRRKSQEERRLKMQQWPQKLDADISGAL